MVGVAAVVGILMLIVESYFVFGFKDVLDLLQKRFKGRATRLSAGC
jgi:hypothetical protein